MTAASNSEALERATAASAHVPTTADVKAAYCVAGMYAGNYATAYLEGLKRFGPEFDAWLAGIAASVPTAQEPAPTLGDAPGADSEALAAREADLAGLTAWFHQHFFSGRCLHWGDGHSQCGSWAAAVLGSSWLADHDRQIAERVWLEGLRFGQLHWATNYAGVYGNGSPLRPAPNPYSKEARRG